MSPVAALQRYILKIGSIFPKYFGQKSAFKALAVSSKKTTTTESRGQVPPMKPLKRKGHLWKFAVLCLLLPLLSLPSMLAAQSAGTSNNVSLSGQVLDPSGALIPGATVTLTRDATMLTATSAADGRYQFRNVAPGTYQLTVDADGFTHLAMPEVLLTATRQLNLSLKVAADQEQVTVTAQATGLSLNSDENANSTILKGSDIDALSDDPDQLLVQLQALAGPSAGPDGGQIYIDGFTGGQLPPKSAILEVHINQNPFSAENDRIGYGRIDILTKPACEVRRPLSVGISTRSSTLRFRWSQSSLAISTTRWAEMLPRLWAREHPALSPHNIGSDRIRPSSTR